MDDHLPSGFPVSSVNFEPYDFLLRILLNLSNEEGLFLVNFSQLSLVTKMSKRTLFRRFDFFRKNLLIKKLSTGKKAHKYLINLEKLREIGIEKSSMSANVALIKQGVPHWHRFLSAGRKVYNNNILNNNIYNLGTKIVSNSATSLGNNQENYLVVQSSKLTTDNTDTHEPITKFININYFNNNYTESKTMIGSEVERMKKWIKRLFQRFEEIYGPLLCKLNMQKDFESWGNGLVNESAEAIKYAIESCKERNSPYRKFPPSLYNFQELCKDYTKKQKRISSEELARQNQAALEKNGARRDIPDAVYLKMFEMPVFVKILNNLKERDEIRYKRLLITYKTMQDLKGNRPYSRDIDSGAATLQLTKKS